VDANGTLNAELDVKLQQAREISNAEPDVNAEPNVNAEPRVILQQTQEGGYCIIC